jgi:hypothetical protein
VVTEETSGPLLEVLLPKGADDPVGNRNLDRVQVELRRAGVARISVIPPFPNEVWRFALDSDAAWIWIHYPDLLLPFEKVIEEVERCRYPALKPYHTFQRLTQAESEADSPTVSDPKPLGKTFGKASFVVRKELFLALGGLHPELHLDGDEGFEFSKRLRYFFPKIPTVPVQGRWLFRPQPPAEREARARSSKRRKSLQEQFDNDPYDYLERFPRLNLKEIRRLIRKQALAPTNPYPPVPIPTSLPGSLWGLTTYFNPENYQSKRDNFQRFRENLKLPLCVVELAFDERPFELGPKDADVLIQLRGGDILWQKEQLLNVGLDRLPSECDKVCWLDADVLFDNLDWPKHTSRLLEDFAVVQPFSLSVRLQPGESKCATDDLPLGSAEHEVLHSMAYGVAAKGPECFRSYLEHGHSGYAWAARRAILQKHGFYHANVLGNADLNIAQAMFGGDRYLKVDRLSPAALAHLNDWANAFFGSVRGSVTYVEGTLYHLWHGYKQNRMYHGRLEVLIEHEFDPDKDLAISPEGPLVWSSDKPALHDWCRRYFAQRDEDKV